MSRRVLITGWCGLHRLVRDEELIAHGYEVRVFDALVPQVHGSERRRPSYLSPDVELVVGDVRDPMAVRRALAGVDIVYHLASSVGVAQSMYEIAEYTSVNNLGTAVLLEAILEQRVERLIVASSMSVYGEGLYRDDGEQIYDRVQRAPEQLARGEWDPVVNGRTLTPVPTPETKAPTLASVYALSKYDQERMCLMIGAAYKIPTVALRFFNVYGPRQALSNPHRGTRIRRAILNAPPVLFEDGHQRRDFVHVRDVASVPVALMPATAAFNVGSGQCPRDRRAPARVLGRDIEPQITGQYRVGDIRHCTADIGLARRVLGYRPAVQLDEGLAELAEWLASQNAVDRVEDMRADLSKRGLAL
jgi:dTDP-L-rhamnose 4-epimerase